MGVQYKSNRCSQKLLQLLEGVNNWNLLERKIGLIQDTKEKGDLFEEFSKLFFILTSKYDGFNFKNIWSFNDVPELIRQKLSIVQQKDYGIDIIIECENGDLWAVQCKFRTNREQISHREISTFYRSSKFAKFKLIISNSHSVATPLETEQKDEGSVLGNDLDLIEESFWDMLRDFLTNLRINRLDYLKKPFDYQDEIVEKSINYFDVKDNGQLIMACGSGKTYVSLWIKERLKPLNTIVFVPSLALMKQTFNEWTNQRKDDFYYSCICSDKTVVSDADEPHIAMSEFGVPVTTNEAELIGFLKDESKNHKVVFSTYQSTDVILKAVRQLDNFKFDFGVFDEAHKTSGKAKRRFTACLTVPIKKRLFMTATPKIYLEYLREKAKEEDIELYSMDDTSVYGQVISELKFGDAINKGILVDYKIKVIFITNEEVKNLIRRCQELQIEDKYGYFKDVSADRFAKQIAIIKSMKEANRVISFHTTIKEAKKFSREQDTISIPNTVQLMKEAGKDVQEIKTFHITGNFPTSKRSDILKEFGECRKAILSNARCLTEGVDLPAIDGVYFVDPKRSIVDIVQATGRAIRKDKKNPNKIGYIIISIFVSENEDPNQILQTGAFKQVWKIVNAMKSQDERIMEVIDKLKMDRVKEYYDDKALDKKEHQKLVKEFDRFIELENIPSNFNKEEFIKSIRLKTIDTLGSAWFEWYERLIDYNMKNQKWPHVHTKGKENRLGKWVGNQRRQYKEGILEKEKEELFRKIGFPLKIWGTLDELWMKNYTKLKEYKNSKDRWPPNLGKDSKRCTHEEIRLGSWFHKQRALSRENKLSQDRIDLLNQIAGDWINDSTTYHRDKLWEQQYLEFIEFRKKNPDRLPMHRNKDERRLHRWVHTQKRFFKKNKLSPDRLQKLQKINFPFVGGGVTPGRRFGQERSIDMWLKIYNALKEYKEERKKWPPAVGRFGGPYSEDEVSLGNWIRTQRQLYNQSKLSEQKIQKLREIEFPFEPPRKIKPVKKKEKPKDKVKKFEKPVLSWEEWYELLKEFRQRNPNNWPIRKGSELELARWCSQQRTRRKKDQLPKGQVDKLNEITFDWNPRKNNMGTWIKKYNELIEYKNKYLKPNQWPHARMKDEKAIELGKWVSAQRQRYKQKKLEKEKLDLLIKIDFVFTPQEDIDIHWMKMYEGLKKFKEMNNRWPRRINPPKDEYTKFENKFGQWAYIQAGHYKNKRLSQEKIDLLNKIDFDWRENKISNYRPDVWEKKFQQLKEFREKHNRWPQPYNEGEKKLHNFWKGQKRAYMLGQITPKRIEKLKEIEGFTFERRAYPKKKK